MSIRTAESEIELEDRLQSGRLKLDGLGLAELPDDLFKLHHLTSLDLSGNHLTRVGDGLRNLSRLETLILHNNKFSMFPAEVLSLVDLKELDVSYNNISALPDQLDVLSKLYYLKISGNPLGDRLDPICNLSNLEILIASKLGAAKFPLSVTLLRKLRTLNLNDNNFVSIPHEFTKLSTLSDLYVSRDRLTIPPPEIVERGPGAIINYLHAFGKQGPSFVLREAKLLIVGEGAVGKTCLVHRLIAEKFISESQTTEGIEINTWEVRDSDNLHFRINVWDFGGQEIYHSTHQFFLTKRSLYLFLWEARKEENIHNFDYWLSVVSLLGRYAPILIVMNKSDERIKAIDEESLQKKFPNIVSFHQVSAKSGKGIQGLRQAVIAQVTKLPHVGDVLPMAWEDIRKRLSALDVNYIPAAEYFQICSKFKLNRRQGEYLSQYFHDLGVFLHFQDNEILKRIIFLKPDWATGAVYKLIDTKSVQERLGRFERADLVSIWADYPDERHVELLELMKKFELCFEIRDSEHYIVPELLGSKVPQIEWKAEGNLHFQYQYDFMPSGILARFIVRLHDLIVGKNYWKNGVMLRRDDTEALIVSEPLFRRIKIKIRGAERPAMLSIIRRELEAIHLTLNGPLVEQTVPCTCSACRAGDAPYMHNYDYLRRARSRRKLTVECKNSLDDVYIDDVLGNIRGSIRSADGGGAQHSDVAGLDTIRVGSRDIVRQYSEDMKVVGIESGEFLKEIVNSVYSLRNKEREVRRLDRIIVSLKAKPDDLDVLREWSEFCKENQIPLPELRARGSMRKFVEILFGV
jgi:small GTP-binding protein